jgi:16S rRNA (cytidine1402-2'-O)-methyltransferase
MTRMDKTHKKAGADHSQQMRASLPVAEPGGNFGSLFIVATPIGNLADMTQRAVSVLSDVSVIYCEDTRTSRTLMQHHNIRTPLLALHQHNENARISQVEAKLRAGESVALISDAGTPLISDPGYALVAALRAHGFLIYAIPGASALTAGLSICGLPTDRFIFEGFLPAAAKARGDRLAALVDEPRTLVFYEASHRIAETLAQAAQIFGDARMAAVVKEISKHFEQCFTEPLAALAARFAADANLCRGEFVFIVAPCTVLGAVAQSAAEVEAKRVFRLLSEEFPPSQSAKLAAKLTGVSRRLIYQDLKSDVE